MIRLLTESRRFLATVRYLTPMQIQVRSIKILRHQWRRMRQQRVHSAINWQISAETHPLYQGLADVNQSGPWQTAVNVATESASAVANHRFCFLAHTVDFDEQINWHTTTVSQLWRYNLHYFNYVQELLVWAYTGHRAHAYATLRELVNSWIENNQLLIGDGWHPYTLSLRLVNWLHAAQGFATELSADEGFRSIFFGSLYAQAQFLYANLELDVRGNHLLENIRALIWAGIFFKGEEAKRWLKKGMALLKVEVAEQILADGGHFERTPTYHLIVLQDLLEIALWLRRNQQAAPIWLEHALRRMVNYLCVILPPTGKIPLIKDSAWDVALPPQALLAAAAIYFQDATVKFDGPMAIYPLLLFGLAGWHQLQCGSNEVLATPTALFVPLPESGYYVVRDTTNMNYLIWDAGKPCPDYLPAHAHADMFSYELIIGGQQVVVDSGVYEYAAGPWRNFFRSTRAHNTVELEGQNQSDVWSSFRVGRRAQPGPVFCQANGDTVLLQAQHNGYCRLPVSVIHRRTIWIKQNLFWLIVDELIGEGSVAATNYVHLHPQLTLTAVDPTTWQILGTDTRLWLTAFGQQTHKTIKGQSEPHYQGWYAEKFGRMVPNQVLALHQEAKLNACFGYIIAKDSASQVHTIVDQEQVKLHIVHNSAHFTLCLSPQLPPKLL